MNIYAKLTSLCLFLVFFTSLTVLYFARQEAGLVLEATITEKLLLKASKSIGSIDRFLYERLHDIRLLAHDPVLQNPQADKNLIHERLQVFKKINHLSESVSFFDMQRVRIADTEGLALEQQHSLNNYWKKLQEKEVVFDVSKSESLGKIVIHFAAIVKDNNGKKIGIVVARVLISRLYEVFANSDSLMNKPDLLVDLVDAKQNLLYSNHNLNLLTKINIPIQSNQVIDSQDTLKVVAFQEGYMDFKGEKWALIISIPKNVAFVAQNQLTRKTLYVIVPTLTIAVFLTLFVAKRFSRPIRHLTEVTREIGSGNLDTPIMIQRSDEIGILAKNFKKMALNLKIKINELHESNLRLNQLNLKLEEKYQKIIKQKRKIETQKQQIEAQNNLLNEAFKEIENKNKAITASIMYAERIQTAILPKKNVLFEAFPKSFILDLPKDIVSGDFYWFDNITFQNQDYFIIAVADCTGHGVPGGFMSILGSNLFTSIVDGEIIKSPSAILSALNLGIRRALHQDIEKNHDGMDVALCVIDKINYELRFSGAHRPLYMLREGQFSEIKGEKCSMGGASPKLHKNGEATENIIEHKIDLLQGDRFYIFSDGYKDQIGAEDGKLYSSKRFRHFLTTIQEKDIVLHGGLLHKELENWKGKQKQTDDILIVGFEV